MENLAGKFALVTGSTDGVGRMVASQLAQAGAEVVVHGRDADRGRQVVAEIEAGGGRAISSRPTFPTSDKCARSRNPCCSGPSGSTFS